MSGREFSDSQYHKEKENSYAVRNPSMEENPCINVDFENEEESCLEAATMMMDEGYKMVTPFFIEDGGKAGTYSWEYVNAHLVVRTK